MRYEDLAAVLRENEQIFEQIKNHAHGGPPPLIPGMTPEANRAMATSAGRNSSREFTRALADQVKALGQHRQAERTLRQKRPVHILEQHVGASSQLVAAYVSRMQWLAEQL